MADEEEIDNEEGKDASKASSGGKKKLILLVVMALVIIGISVGGTLAALKFLGPQPATVVEEEGAEAEVIAPPPAPAIYYPIKPAIIVSFDYKGRQRYLQVDMTLMVRENSVISAIELHMPKIRNALNITIGGKLYEELQTAEGKELLRQECLQQLQQIMQEEIGKPGIEQVLYTNFVMQ